MTVDDIRIRDDVEQGAEGGPGFKTTIIGVGSGFEQRNEEWERARGEWDMRYPFFTKADFMELIRFFYGRRGRERGFRFKDWSDFESDGRQTIGTGNGLNTDFQLINTYADLVNPYVRRITRPVDSTVRVWVDDVEIFTFTIESLGIIRIIPAPADTLLVESEYEFDVPVRFDTDKMVMQVRWYNAAAWQDISILEIKE